MVGYQGLWSDHFCYLVSIIHQNGEIEEDVVHKTDERGEVPLEFYGGFLEYP